MGSRSPRRAPLLRAGPSSRDCLRLLKRPQPAASCAALPALARGKSDVEYLTPPGGQGAQQGVKTPEASLNGGESYFEVKTATKPPVKGAVEDHVDMANRQIKAKGKTGDISLDWSAGMSNP